MQPELANPRIPSATPFTHASRAPHPSSRATNHCPETCNPYPTPKPSSLMPGQLFTQYFLTDGIRATPERRAQAPAFAAFHKEARRLFHDFANYPQPQRNPDRTGPHSPPAGASWLDRRPPPANLQRRRRHPRPAPLRRRPGQDPRRIPGQPLPRSPRRRRAQALPPPPRHPRHRQGNPGLLTPRPDPSLPRHRRNRHRRPSPLGHPHQRRGLASLRPERPAPAPPPSTKPTSRPC